MASTLHRFRLERDNPASDSGLLLDDVANDLRPPCAGGVLECIACVGYPAPAIPQAPRRLYAVDGFRAGVSERYHVWSPVSDRRGTHEQHRLAQAADCTSNCSK